MLPLLFILACLHFTAEELLLHPRVRIHVRDCIHMENVRANVKVLEF